MNIRKWTWVLSLVVALGLALGGARTVSAAPGVDHLPQTKTPASGKFVLSGSISSEGSGGVVSEPQTIPVSGSGAFSGDDAMLDVTLTAPEGVTSGPDKIMFSIIALDNKLYFKTSGLGIEDDKWYVADLDSALTGMPGSVMGMPGSMTDLEAMVHAAISSKEVGKETINGVATTKYQLDVDVEKLAIAAGGSTEGLEDVTLSMLLWVGDADMYVHQFSVTYDIETTSGDITFSLMIDLMVTFSDFDMPVTITAPPDAEPIDEELATILGGMPISTTGPPETTVGMPRSGSGIDNTMLIALLAVSMGLVLSGVAVRRAARARV
ncbi:MAG TPA: hypothetical protein VJ183_19000 [Chloroflexia bacterium]|nr:hypothetical protein [Chloroflexia bacterium]